MILLPFFVSIVFVGRCRCVDSESLEINEIEASPFYDAIIFSDIADIINEIDNNPNAPLADVSRDNENEGDDNIENLLSEYHKHLEKAHKQQKAFENSKIKNKLPLLTQERVSQAKPILKFGDYSSIYYNKDYNRYPHSQQGSFSFFMPMKTNYVPNVQRISKSDIFPYYDYGLGNKKTLSRTSKEFKPIYDWMQSDCHCKTNKVPCECNCKKCVSPFQSVVATGLNDRSLSEFLGPPGAKTNQQTSLLKDNTINIKIKVSLSLQNLSQILQNNRNFPNTRVSESSEQGKINIPLTYLDFPMPLDMFSSQKNTDSSGSLKTAFHKKKRARFNNNKRHSKKVITLHQILIEPHQLLDNVKIESDNNTERSIQSVYNVTIKNDLKKLLNNTKKRGDESISLLINITNNDDESTTEVPHAIANSIESEQNGKTKNITTHSFNIRLKRSLLLSDQIKVDRKLSNVVLNQNKTNKEDNNISKIRTTAKELFNKKIDKGVFADEELLHWMNTANVSTKNMQNNIKNITAIILEREKNKTKITISKETIRRNHTKALEQAIFGEVDWDDIDVIAPAFLSFIGKYLNGVLTFCSSKTCHSMKCGNKICFHRICIPEFRINIKGHCAGSNSTDSITSLESIMDLPSNIGFEIVDILQDRMLGKLFGKATLCIAKKCITFWSVKKIFLKIKCLNKELDLAGHCKNTKQVKAM